tara:strand:+ start:820 stop:1065 length:246 start_codon:yes stop_codon:yes gene_type:complete
MKALFSIDNNYDQPRNNLVCVWKKRPTLERLAQVLDKKFPAHNDPDTLLIVKLWNEETVRIDDIDYRIELIHFDTKIGEMT